MPIKLFDTSELICLLEVICDLELFKMFSEANYEIVITQKVYEEYCKKGNVSLIRDLIGSKKIKIVENSKDDDVEFKCSIWGLDAGEVTVIDYAQSNNHLDLYTVIGETSAREFIKKYDKITNCGIIGLIKRLKNKGLLNSEILMKYFIKIKNSKIRVNHKMVEEEWDLDSE